MLARIAIAGICLLSSYLVVAQYDTYESCASSLQYSPWTKYASFAQTIAFGTVVLIKLSTLSPVLLTSRSSQLDKKEMDGSSAIVESGAMLINVLAGIASFLQFLGWDNICTINSR